MKWIIAVLDALLPVLALNVAVIVLGAVPLVLESFTQLLLSPPEKTEL